MPISLEDEPGGIKDPGNNQSPESNDDTFHLENLDEYPGELPEEDENISDNASYKNNMSADKQNERNEMENNSTKHRNTILYIALAALIIMLAALIYDWGVNREGFSDVANLLTKDKTVTSEKIQQFSGDKEQKDEEQIIAEGETVVEEEIYGATPETVQADEYIIIEEEKIDKDISEPRKPIEQESEITQPIKTYKEDDSFKEDGGIDYLIKRTEDIDKRKEELKQAFSIREKIHRSDVPNENRIYTVQVYSTPSKSDAEAWKTKLENMDIKNVSISSQIIKDKDWYRVRIGFFKTLGEAEQEALKLGFAQSWIDRVK